MCGQDGGDLHLRALRVGEPASELPCAKVDLKPLQIGQIKGFDNSDALPRIEYMFDIGSPAAASPSGTRRTESIAARRTLTLPSSIFPEQAAGTAVPAAAFSAA